MSNSHLEYDAIKDEHLDNLIRLSFKHTDALETQDIIDVTEHDFTAEEEALKNSAYALFLSKLKVQETEQKHVDHILHWKLIIPRIIEIAACIVLIAGIAAPFAVANVEFIRVKVMQLLVSIQDNQAEISMIGIEEASFYVPVDWSGTYYPSYIPDGFEITEQSSFHHRVTYSDGAGKKIHFGEYSQKEDTSIDSEDAQLSFEIVNSTTALILEKGGYTTVIWGNGENYFYVSTNVSRNEGIRIAESIQKIIPQK